VIWMIKPLCPYNYDYNDDIHYYIRNVRKDADYLSFGCHYYKIYAVMLPLQVSMFLEVLQIDYEHTRTTPMMNTKV
jgi:hypothetical protein